MDDITKANKPASVIDVKREIEWKLRVGIHNTITIFKL